MTGFAILSTTVVDATEADGLAHALIEARLAGCVQVLPVRSHYRWRDAVQRDDEHLLLCKIDAATFDEVATFIRARHSYDVPEIVMTPIEAADAPYRDWLAAAVQKR